MADIIRLENVKKVYRDGQFKALDGVSLAVKKGEFLVVRGRSGSGKSTLLHIMGCLDTPNKGEVYIDEQRIRDLKENELAAIRRKKIGFVFQAFNLVPNINAMKNVALPMLFNGIKEAERDGRAIELLKSVGLGDKVDNFPNEMSGGERQRVAIARALANNPRIILADEPTGNLDSISAKQVLEIFDKLHRKEGRTIVMVTHEQYVSALAERVQYIQDGKLVSKEKMRSE